MLYLLGSVFNSIECSCRTMREKGAKECAVRVNGIVYVRSVSGVLIQMNLSNTPAQGKRSYTFLDYKC